MRPRNRTLTIQGHDVWNPSVEEDDIQMMSNDGGAVHKVLREKKLEDY